MKYFWAKIIVFQKELRICRYMGFKKLFILVAILFINILKGQDTNEILLTIDGEKVYSSEFVRIFQKNKDIVVDEEERNFDDYFDLFVNFKVKLKQAYDLKLDTVLAYKEELAKYKEILTTPYLQDTTSTEFLVKEAYERTVTEVNASHILIRVSPEAMPIDTLTAFNRITEARRMALSGLSFEQVAKKYSEDPSVQSNGGNLGYFSAFDMVYSFENAAFNTDIGDVSSPFRTQFGYHILRVIDRRVSLGEIQVAHIMVKKNVNDSTFAKNKIFEIYQKLKQGDDFAQIAKEHSDDTNSAIKGGVLPQFGSGRMLESFDKVAFSLSNIGDFSEPFRTEFGWHILKLLKKIPIESFEEQYSQLENKIQKGSRFKYVEKALAQNLKSNYKVIENRSLLSAFYNQNIDEMKSDITLLTIEDQSFSMNDFYIYYSEKKGKIISELYEDFIVDNIIDYYKNNLQFTNKEFSETYKEYKDGLLLFELLQKNIWEKSENDSIGLTNFFNKNRTNYMWKVRGELSIASCTTLEKAELVKKYLEEGKSIEKIKNLLNEGATVHVLFSTGVLETGSSKLPKKFKMTVGVSEIYNMGKNQYTIIKVDNIIQASNKKLSETRGEVINDYQTFLETEWVKSLKEHYKIEINKNAFNKLKKQYSNYK